jgi:hypothetical protein
VARIYDLMLKFPSNEGDARDFTDKIAREPGRSIGGAVIQAWRNKARSAQLRWFLLCLCLENTT